MENLQPPRRCCVRLAGGDFVSRQRWQRNRFRATRTVCGSLPGTIYYFRYSLNSKGYLNRFQVAFALFNTVLIDLRIRIKPDVYHAAIGEAPFALDNFAMQRLAVQSVVA